MLPRYVRCILTFEKSLKFSTYRCITTSLKSLGLCEKTGPSGLIIRKHNRINNASFVFSMQIARYSSYPPHKVITLPNLSPTMETGSIMNWAKSEGDEINEGDLLAEIETDKATMAFDASEAGFLAKILVPAGTKDIPVRTPLCVIVEDASSVEAFKDFKAEIKKPAAAAPPPAAASPEPAAVTAKPEPTAPAATTPKPAPVQPRPTPVSAASAGQRQFVSPLARRLASEQGLDLTQLGPGTGIRGMIRAADLARAPQAAAAAAVGASMAAFTQLAVSDLRAMLGQRALESKQTVPHYYLTTDILVDEALELREKLEKRLGKRISLTDVIVKAAALACLSRPECNSAWQPDGQSIRQYHSVDVNIALATPDGLITPVVCGADTKGLVQIHEEIEALASKAKENQLQPQDIQGGTFTVSNLGMFGVDSFCAIINQPQACLLAVGGVQKQLVPDGDGFRAGHRLSVTLSCDHRVVDGAVGAEWLKEFKSILEQPVLMLA